MLKPYIDMNTEPRKKAKTDFGRFFQFDEQCSISKKHEKFEKT